MKLSNFLIQAFTACIQSVYCNPLVHEMTLEEKVGQILMAHFVGDVLNHDAKALIEEIHIGGVIYYNWANKLDHPDQVRNLSCQLEDLAKSSRLKIPLFIGIDQEGGSVSRLTQGYTVFSGNRALGEINDPVLTENVFKMMGYELKASGVNLNFSPVVDVNINPKNPVIGIRSFGANPKTVTSLAKAAITGLKKGGVIPCLKHFPGHGDVMIDSHLDLPRLDKSLAELNFCDLYPFKKLASKVDVIMTAHLIASAFDDKLPATFSKKTLSYLRNNLGFDGVIISDSIVMEGALKTANSISDAAIKAFNAGCDIILIGGRSLNGSHSIEIKIPELKQIYQDLIDAVKQGAIKESRLNKAVTRILTLKSKRLKNLNLSSKGLIRSKKAIELSKQVATRSLEVSGNSKLSLSNKKLCLFAPKILTEEIKKTQFFDPKAQNVLLAFSEDKKDLSDELLKAKQQAQEADALVLFSHSAWKSEVQKAIFKSLLDLNKPVILVITKDPLDNQTISGCDYVIKTFSPTHVSIEAAYEHLMSLIYHD